MNRPNRVSRRTRLALAIAPLIAGGASVVGVVAQSGTPAFADTQAFEEYCPGTPVGTIVLNGAKATGALTPASPAAGQQFNLTNFQATVNLPSQIVGAAAALGNAAIMGTATVTADATGATPAKVASATINFNVPIPSPVPSTGLDLLLPPAPGTIGPFTASGGPITMTLDSTTQISVTVSGSSLALTCTAYPDMSAPSGITTSKPSAAAVSPVIATSGGSGGGGAATTSPPTTAAPTAAAGGSTTPTTAAPAAPTTPSSGASGTGSLAFTGPGPHLWLIALIGFIVLYLGAVVLALVEDPRTRLRRVLHVAVPTGGLRFLTRHPDRVDTPVTIQNAVPVEPPAFAKATPAPSRAAGLWLEPGLWHTGWEPRDHSD